MNTLVCKNCGSSSFREEPGAYICQHCGTKIVKPRSEAGSRRLKVILATVIGLLVVVVLVYVKVSSVEKKLAYIAPVTVQQDTVPTEKTNDERAFETTEETPVEIERVLQHFAQQPEPKALFISLNRKGRYAFGYAFGKSSVKEATQKAFALCEKERKKRKLKDICTPYVINDHISKALVD